MKKLKLFLCVALFGAMSFGAFSAYEHLTMSDAERALLENVEALTSNEGGSSYETCYSESKVVVGRSYYDCGSCKKVYDEKGTGNISKCFH